MRSISAFEEHGEVTDVWRELGYSGETVVCLDQHLDLKALSIAAQAGVLNARSSNASLSGLNRQLPIRDMSGAFGLDDFWAVGSLTGAVAKLIWLRPSREVDARLVFERSLSQVALWNTASTSVSTPKWMTGGALSVRVGDLEVEMHTQATLVEHGVPDETRVDIDLDFFADDSIEVAVQRLRLIVPMLNMRERLDSVTTSIRSGFTPNSHRPLVAEICRLAGLDVVFLDSKLLALPERTFQHLRERDNVDIGAMTFLESEWDGQSEGLKHMMRGLLNVRTEPDHAVASWELAEMNGTSSTWLAYEIASEFHRSARFEAALSWYERASVDETDVIRGLLLPLRIIDAMRVGRIDDVTNLLDTEAVLYPYSRRILQMSLSVGELLGQSFRVDIAKERLRELTALVESESR